MRISKTMEEILRIKEKISQDIKGMGHEEIKRYLHERRPPGLDDLPRYEKPKGPTPIQRPARPKSGEV